MTVLGIEAQRGHQAPSDVAPAPFDAAERTHVVDHRRRQAPGLLGRMVEPFQVCGARGHLRTGGLVEREELGRAGQCPVAAPAQETPDADALWHVLAAVPSAEVLAPLRAYVLPDGDGAAFH